MKTGVKIELFTDMSMHDFIKRPKEVAYLRLVSNISKPIILRWVRHSTHPNPHHGSHMSMQTIFMAGL